MVRYYLLFRKRPKWFPFNIFIHKLLKSDLGDLEGEEKVFDTWMDSSNSNLYVSGYLSNPELFEKAFPTGIRPQGKEIVRTWLLASDLISGHTTGQVVEIAGGMEGRLVAGTK